MYIRAAPELGVGRRMVVVTVRITISDTEHAFCGRPTLREDPYHYGAVGITVPRVPSGIERPHRYLLAALFLFPMIKEQERLLQGFTQPDWRAGYKSPRCL